MNNKLFIIIPAFNEAKTIGKLTNKLASGGYKNIVVVDDCSSDQTSQIAQKAGVVVLRHVVNRGVGGALRTGFSYTLERGAEIILTMDADLQHRVEDIPKLIKPIANNEVDVVLGVRKMISKKQPFLRKIGNLVANLTTFLFFGLMISDSQSGFRAFSRKALSKMEFHSNRFEIISEMIREIKRHNFKFVEIPVSTIYTKYSLSKGQSFKQGIKTLIRLIVVRFK